MRRQNADGFRSRCVRWFRVIGLMLGGLLLAAASGRAGVLTASWTAPTTYTDGSQLTQLVLYRIYYNTFDSPCPGNTFFEVASSTAIPPPNQTVTVEITGLTTAAIYNISVTAVDMSGNESACSAIASAIARDDSSATTPPSQSDSALTPTGQDDFERPGPDLGLNWAEQRGPGIGVGQIANGRVRPTGSGANEMKNSAAVGSDQFARILIATFTGSGYGDVGAYVLAGAPGDRTFYYCAAAKNYTWTSEIGKRVSGVGTTLLMDSSVNWQAGDRLECRYTAASYTITLLRNDLPLMSVIDTDLTSGGVGLRIREDGDFSQNEIETFEWGSAN